MHNVINYKQLHKQLNFERSAFGTVRFDDETRDREKQQRWTDDNVDTQLKSESDRFSLLICIFAGLYHGAPSASLHISLTGF